MGYYIFIFILGLIIGSFLNCVIYRIAAPLGREKGEGFLSGRSYCPKCEHTVSWKDLVPVLSFLWLRGRCRYCRQRISLQYPFVELATGVIFLLILINYTMVSLISIYYLIISSFLIVIFVYDLKHYIIPDKIIYPAIGISFLFRILNFEHRDLFRVWDLGFGILIAPIFFLAIILISKGKWMGFGDVKLALLMGLILGWPNISAALFLAFFIGAIMGAGLLIAGKKTIKSEIPFGPFLVMGTFIALFWGKEIINWYVQSFFVN